MHVDETGWPDIPAKDAGSSAQPEHPASLHSLLTALNAFKSQF